MGMVLKKVLVSLLWTTFDDPSSSLQIWAEIHDPRQEGLDGGVVVGVEVGIVLVVKSAVVVDGGVVVGVFSSRSWS